MKMDQIRTAADQRIREEGEDRSSIRFIHSARGPPMRGKKQRRKNSR
jgi:hypothetical protein